MSHLALFLVGHTIHNRSVLHCKIANTRALLGIVATMLLVPRLPCGKLKDYEVKGISLVRQLFGVLLLCSFCFDMCMLWFVLYRIGVFTLIVNVV